MTHIASMEVPMPCFKVGQRPCEAGSERGCIFIEKHRRCFIMDVSLPGARLSSSVDTPTCYEHSW